ncbi:MAG: MATE family efflux transporter [Nocardioidaceae bacterium]
MRRPPRPRWGADDAQIARLALPAFVALVSEPLFLLADTAVVGHLGSAPLAALAVAATVVQTVVGLAIFLAYGTTASVGRRLGAGDERGALTTGVSGLWLALLLGTGAAVATTVVARSLVGLFGTAPDVDAAATTYLQIAALGLPAMLVVLATTGVLRGLQDTRTPLVVAVTANLVNIMLNLLLVYGLGLGIAGSALGTTVAQWGAAAALLSVIVRAARRREADLRPRRRGILEAARAGVPLVVRTLTLRSALLLGTLVASSLGTTATAAHQVVVTVVSTLAFALDAVAIAGQAMTGRYLGAGDVLGARRMTRRMLVWGLSAGGGAALVLAAISPWLTAAFTTDPAVRTAAVGALLVVAAVQPVSGVVFVLDGVLIGAGDGRYLAGAGLVTLAAYTPLAALVWLLHAGLAWLWAAYAGFIVARALTLVSRERSAGWLRTGAAVEIPA